MSATNGERAPADDDSVGRAVADNGRLIIGSAPELLAALDRARTLAPTDMPILITGETGTGKELLAHYVHRLSGRTGFMDIDCGTLPPDLTESVLYGHTKGAFTGAVTAWSGLIGLADRGTLFLDEVQSLPPRGQVKLLRALETREIRPIGSGKTRKVDFRLISTASNDITGSLAHGDFRLDLLQRVAGVVIRLPPLRDRRDDIRPLARHFAGEADGTLSPDAEDMLVEHMWPGNVRELRWTVIRACRLCAGSQVTSSVLAEAFELGPASLLPGTVQEAPPPVVELRAACIAHRGDPKRIAEALDIAVSTVYRRVEKAGLTLRDFRSA